MNIIMNSGKSMIILTFFCLILGLSSCGKNKIADTQSPCVSNESSNYRAPCSDRQPVNNWLT